MQKNNQYRKCFHKNGFELLINSDFCFCIQRSVQITIKKYVINQKVFIIIYNIVSYECNSVIMKTKYLFCYMDIENSTLSKTCFP